MTLTQTHSYKELNERSVLSYLEDKRLLTDKEKASCKEVGDGNLNYVFIVKDEVTGKTIVAKQALPYAKVVGESWPLSLERARIEASSLKHAAKTVPDLVPEVYGSDEDYALTVMEDLSDFTILRKGLIEGETYPHLADHVGRFLAQTLFSASDEALGPVEKKKLAKQFINPDLCDITEKLVFSDPYYNADTNSFPEELREDVEALWQNSGLKFEVAKLKKKFLTEGETLLHGDLHTGSIFVTNEETKVIDPEFAFFGPAGFDAGAFLANLFLNYLAQNERQTDEQKKQASRQYLLKTAVKTWEVFEKQYRDLLKKKGIDEQSRTDEYADYLLDKIRTDAIGFAGCKVIRRIIGLAHVEDVDGIENEEGRLRVQRKALELGQELILKRNTFTSISELVTWIGGDQS
ncbi:S-methyl-5-thioribose kinase [Jeotgalibacillus proteolyticus]|uniref:Methylthioribose kinase n=1 Tax=Jeotgalibacillus proteolyticus TaxID=2082395 RepID=A0A2S5GAC1_9BACL|nr:S-methyl-5-thioribose kinase [Jeotgalibacillus proteolyticus]PPA69863.1 S-methyl-5-thioribose kinase [Jeotgalibacillus proteolyticus]